MICEDWWFPDVSETLAESGAEILLSINGSPFEDGKQDRRITLAVERVVETGLPYVFAALTGGQDEIVFDGASFVLNADRTLAVQLPAFEESVTLTSWTRTETGLVCDAAAFAAGTGPPGADLRRHDDGPARLREQKRLSGRRARPLGRHRQRHLRRRRRRRAGAGPRPRRHAPQPLYLRT